MFERIRQGLGDFANRSSPHLVLCEILNEATASGNSAGGRITLKLAGKELRFLVPSGHEWLKEERYVRIIELCKWVQAKNSDFNWHFDTPTDREQKNPALLIVIKGKILPELLTLVKITEDDFSAPKNPKVPSKAPADTGTAGVPQQISPPSFDDPVFKSIVTAPLSLIFASGWFYGPKRESLKVAIPRNQPGASQLAAILIGHWEGIELANDPGKIVIFINGKATARTIAGTVEKNFDGLKVILPPEELAEIDTIDLAKYLPEIRECIEKNPAGFAYRVASDSLVWLLCSNERREEVRAALLRDGIKAAVNSGRRGETPCTILIVRGEDSKVIVSLCEELELPKLRAT